MSDDKKQEVRFTLIPTIEITDEESRPFWSRSVSQVEQPVETQEKSSIPSLQAPKLFPYTPPDTLMFPLFSAIQRKAWTQAKRLCHELVLCDPDRTIYHELYVRLDQITNLMDQRRYPQSAVSQSTTPCSDGEKSNRQQSQ